MKSPYVSSYIQAVATKYSCEETSEMGYRTDFELLLKNIFESINVTRFDNDPKAREGNKPDFVVIKNEIPLLYIETKDIGVSLDKVEKSDQMSRYFGYANLVLTDYLEFRFYRNGEQYGKPIKIADFKIRERTISPKTENYEYLVKTLLDFTQSHKEPIKSGRHLAKIMGGKAQRIRDNIRHFYSSESQQNTDLIKLYKTLSELLVHDLTIHSFADMYAQTLVYGLFVARYYDKSLDSFTRQEARDLIPNSNPFLRRFFDHIVGADFDARLKHIVDELCDVFSHANIKELMKEYFKQNLWGNTHRNPDPVIHFYEDFLNEYDPILRKKMGAYYTPLPIVEFIIRSVDHLLEREFGLAGGLANTSKTKEDIHRVQILDPACGTGTFISEIIRTIYKSLDAAGQKGRWSTYVHHELLPRLYGFELMMAPYTIAHLKLGIAFRQTGFWDFHRRLGIYLTNSLEEGTNQQTSIFNIGLAESIAEESKEASKIKKEKPIMIVIGNPPYNVSSSNKGRWIQDLIKVYKQNLNEKKINIDDDYIKFIRFAEHFIEKNGSGIVAMITNNSFIDGITHRQMRKHLLETFNNIYILDLHGDAKESPPNGKRDENVFDIQQGVSINIFIKNEIKDKDLGVIHYQDVYGRRSEKFEFLNKSGFNNVKWKKLKYSKPFYFFTPKDFRLEHEYQKGFKLDELFIIQNSGVKTDRDSLFIDRDRSSLRERMVKLLSGDYDNGFRNEFRVQDSGSYKLTEKLKGKIFDEKYLQRIQYRPFDYQWIYYDPTLISRPANKVLKHFIGKQNIGMITNRQVVGDFWNHAGVTQQLSSHGTFYLGNKGQDYLFPLYLYSDADAKTSNFKEEIVNEIINIVGKVLPEDIFDYIYAVLHSPNYRERYKEFLKIDFPRIPFPQDKKSFQRLVKLGRELRLLHLFESPKSDKLITSYPETGSDAVEKIEYKDGKVFLNSSQYFGNVPELAWNFWIGGYQPAQKWLKDRKGRKLTNEDIVHYQKIIVILVETSRIMGEIDKSTKI